MTLAPSKYVSYFGAYVGRLNEKSSYGDVLGSQRMFRTKISTMSRREQRRAKKTVRWTKLIDET